MQKSLFGSFAGVFGSVVNARADLVKGFISHYGPASEGVVEYAVGLLLAGSEPQRQFLGLLGAMCGVPLQLLQEYHADSSSNLNFAYCYSSLSSKLATLAMEGQNRLVSVQLCHVLLQEYHLRFDQLPAGGIQLREAFVQLALLLEKHSLSHLCGSFCALYHLKGSAASDVVSFCLGNCCVD